jgi:hypothetical protein
MHVLVTDYSVLLVVLLNFHTDIEDIVCNFIDGQFLDWVIEHIIEFDQHSSQDSLIRMCDFIGFISCQFSYLLACKSRFSDNWTHSDVGVDEINGCVSSWIKHFLERENIIWNSVLFQVVVFNWSHPQLFSSVFVLLRFQCSEDLFSLFLFAFSNFLFLTFFSALQLIQSIISCFIK